MGIKFACHQCGEALNIKTQLAGKRGKCPSCGLRFRIPKTDQPFSIPLEEAEVAMETPHVELESTPAEQPALASASQPPAVDTPSAVDTPPADIDFDPLQDENAQWYVRPPNGGRYGPANGTTVRQWIREGRVTRTTLIWRDGWAQWRDCDEIIPEAFEIEAIPQGQIPPPQIHVDVGNPIIDVDRTQAAMAGTGVTRKAEGNAADTYLGAKKRRRFRQRTTLISILAGVALILVVALVVALAWPR